MIEDHMLSAFSFGAIGDGESHPLRDHYSCLSDAQTQYPCAVSLDDEIDWCAWQGMADYFYSRDTSDTDTHNWSAGSAVVDGVFVVNKTITFNLSSIRLVGLTPGGRTVRGTISAFVYNGPDGTVDEPVWIIDSYLFDEFGNPPPGRIGNSVYSGGGKTEIEGVTFSGKAGNMNGTAGDESGYVSGVRIRKGSFVKIAGCSFGGTLWDATSFTDAQLFPVLERNFFYGVYRDAVVFHHAANFTTTTWIMNNEFGFVGRYHILGDFRGSIDSSPIIRDNSFERGNSGFFPSNPEWWVGGVVSPVCLIGAKTGVFEANRFEQITDAYPAYWADFTLIGGLKMRVSDGVCRNIALGELRDSPTITSALDVYKAAYGYADITNARTYNLGEPGNARAGVRELIVENIYNLNKVVLVGGSGAALSRTGQHVFSNLNAIVLDVPVLQGKFAHQVGPRATTVATLGRIMNAVYKNCLVVDVDGVRGYLAGGTRLSGEFIARPGRAFAHAWEATHSYGPGVPKLNLANAVTPVTENGYIYQCIEAGTTGESEPVWPTKLFETVVDGTVTWRCTGFAYVEADVGHNGTRMTLSGGRAISTRREIPTAGNYRVGDAVHNSYPQPGDHMGWVCTESGEAGVDAVFKPWGKIDA